METNEQQQPGQQQINPGQEGSNNSDENVAAGNINENEDNETTGTDEGDAPLSGAGESNGGGVGQQNPDETDEQSGTKSGTGKEEAEG